MLRKQVTELKEGLLELRKRERQRKHSWGEGVRVGKGMGMLPEGRA